MLLERQLHVYWSVLISKQTRGTAFLLKWLQLWFSCDAPSVSWKVFLDLQLSQAIYDIKQVTQEEPSLFVRKQGWTNRFS